MWLNPFFRFLNVRRPHACARHILADKQVNRTLDQFCSFAEKHIVVCTAAVYALRTVALFYYAFGVYMLLSSQAPNTIIYNDINDNKTLIQWRKSHSERGRGAAAATRQTFYAYLHIVSVARIISTKTTVPFCKDHPAIVFRANVCHRVVIVYTILIYKYTQVYL